MEALQTQSQARQQAANSGSPSKGKYQRCSQPMDVINVPGALLRLDTLALLSGEHVSTLYRAAQRGELVLTKRGLRCTRVSSENARAYLARLDGGAA